MDDSRRFARIRACISCRKTKQELVWREKLQTLHVSNSPIIYSHSDGLVNTHIPTHSSWIIGVFGWPPEAVYYTFIGGAISSYIEDALVVTTSILVGVPLLTVLKKVLNLKNL